MNMFCVHVGAVYIHLAHCRLFMVIPMIPRCLSHPYSLTLIMNDQLSSEHFVLFSELSHTCILNAGQLRWIWQVMLIFETSMVARLCEIYHNIIVAWLHFAHTNV